MIHVIPEGTTEAQDFQLLDDGEALVGTGLTVTLEIVQRTGTAAGSPVGSPGPTVAWLVQASGTVRVSGVETLGLGEYSVRYKLTDGAGDFGYCPNGYDPDTWEVVKVTP